jgi:hypothetical protein
MNAERRYSGLIKLNDVEFAVVLFLFFVFVFDGLLVGVIN